MSDKFDYTYAAPTKDERQEIDSIRRQYVKEEPVVSKIEELRKLDKKVRKPPLIIALIVGTLGWSTFGGGMALCLETTYIAVGVVLGVIGAALMIANYPVYKFLLDRRKQKYGDEIIKLSDELLNQ